MNAIAAANFSIDQLIGGNARFERPIVESAVAFLFRKKVAAIGDDKAEIAGAGLVHPRKTSFRMPWLVVNHTLLCWFKAVPAAVLALEVRRGGIPGQPGA